MFGEGHTIPQRGRKAAAVPAAALGIDHAPESVYLDAEMASRKVLNNPELTRMVIQWLKEVTLEEEEVEFEDDEKPHFSASWTCHFARLTTVNRSFFHASIDVLWERLTSYMPLFGYVLPADKDKKGVPNQRLGYRTQDLTFEHWDRFTLYSSRVKILVLDESSPKMTSGWMSHLLNSESRPHTLFPSLQRSFLGIQTPLALYIAHNCISSVRFVEVELTGRSKSDSRDNAKALLNGLRQNALSLTDLRMKYPVTPNVINEISRLLSLASLEVTVGSRDGQDIVDIDAFDLGRLARLPFLRTLKIRHDFDENDRRSASIMPRGVIDIQGIVSQKAKFIHLRTLRIVANGMTQYRLAKTLLPVDLTTLEIVVARDILNIQAVLIPLVVTIYAQRNPSLNHLDITTDDWSDLELSADSGVLPQYRNNPHYSNIEPFYKSIGSLHHLTHFSLNDVLVLDAAMVPRLVKIVLGLPLLKTLIIEPNPMTDLDDDDLTVPPLDVLREFALSHPHLESLELLVDLSHDIPKISEDGPSVCRLKTIALPTFGSQELDLTEEKKFSLAHYLENLFPQVRIRTSAFVDGSDEGAFWTSIDRMLLFSRESKAQLLRQLEKGWVQGQQ
ncbi:hypothetical protein NMY22_g831 [Coprinellus aureogranulatus]|nr:hypothetical protein NMY22_g831 [Coprinellus aureogranulatus]